MLNLPSLPPDPHISFLHDRSSEACSEYFCSLVNVFTCVCVRKYSIICDLQTYKEYLKCAKIRYYL